MPNYGITAPIQASGFPHKTALMCYDSGISGFRSLDITKLEWLLEDIRINTDSIEINVSGINVDIVDPTGAGLLQSGVTLLQDISGRLLFQNSGTRDTNRLTIDLFDTSSRLSGISGSLVRTEIATFDTSSRLSGISGSLVLLETALFDTSLRVSGLSGKLGEVTGLLLTNNINANDISNRISGLSGKLSEVTGLLLTANIDGFDNTQRLSGISGLLNRVTGKLSNIYEYFQTGVNTTRQGTGSSIIVTAVNSTGTFRLVSYFAKKAIFVNHRDPAYRVYKNNETGLDYLRYLPCMSGGWAGRTEVEGITDLNEIAIQTDNTATSNLSGVCIAYF